MNDDVDLDALAAEFADGLPAVKGVFLSSLKPNVDYRGHTRDNPTSSAGLLFALRGRARFSFDGTPYDLEPGRVAHGAANMTLKPRVQGDSDFEYVLVHYELAGRDRARIPGRRPYADSHYLLEPGELPGLADRLQLLHRTWNASGGLASLRAKELFYGILGDVLEAARRRGRREGDDPIGRIVEYIHRFYMEPHSLGSLAERSGGMDVKRFSYLFRKRTGFFPIDYVIRQRMLQARRLLATSSYGVARIAESVGYADAHYFSRLFRKYEGCSPTEYRRRLGNCPPWFR